MIDRLMQEPIVSVDTESNSLYAYHERVCLVQFSIPGQDYLLDPLAVQNLDALGSLFAEPKIEKVFHAAEYDVMVLHRDYGFAFAGLFDTMWASRIVGWKKYGLGNLLKRHFDIRTDKRMQRTNWGKRPLSDEQLAYAQLDTHFLLPLRQMLLSELQTQNRMQEARLAFERVAQSRWSKKEFDPNGFWSLKGAHDLDEPGLAVLAALYVFREQRAQRLDRPPFKVLSRQALINLSRSRPQSLDELKHIKGVPRRLSIKNRKKLLEIIAKNMHHPPPQEPTTHPPRRYNGVVEARYQALRGWRKDRSEKRGVEPDVILSNHVLHQLARLNPTSLEKLSSMDLLGDWERQEYGQEIVAVLRKSLA